MNDTLVTLGLFLFVLYLSVDGFFSMYDDSVQWGIYLFKLIQSVLFFFSQHYQRLNTNTATLTLNQRLNSVHR
jgi:hypothetical protein